MPVKNRKRNSGGFAFPLPAAVFLALTVTLLLLYVWLDAHNQALGVRIRKLEQKLVKLEKNYDHELWKWEMMKSPANIENALARNRMVMVVPDARSVVRLSGSKARNELLAGRESPGPMARLDDPYRVLMND